MNSLLKDRIRKDFPNIAWEGPASQRDIECGTGWGLLLYTFFLDATALCETAGGSLVISQIKNKFGTLHLYCHQKGGAAPKSAKKEYLPENYGRVFSFRPYPVNPTLRSIVTHYEQASPHVCELCGKSGHIDREVSDWLVPLCHPHAALLKKTRYRDSPEKYDVIDRDAAKSILAHIDELADKVKK